MSKPVRNSPVRASGVRVGRPPATSREKIAAGALELARQDGLDAVTIRRLAGHMRVTPKTLYNHVTTKEEIIDLMVAAALESIDAAPDRNLAWPAQLHAAMMSLYEVLTENYVIVELLVDSRAMIGPALDRTRDEVLTLISGVPMDQAEAIDLFNALGAFVIGVAAVEGGRARRADVLVDHLSGLSPEEFPALAKGRDLWMRPLPREHVVDSLWMLIRGFAASADQPEAGRAASA